MHRYKIEHELFGLLEDLCADEVASDTLRGLDDFISLEFSGHFGRFFAIFFGSLSGNKTVSLQSYDSFDITTVGTLFVEFFAEFELEFHAFEHGGGLEVPGLGVGIIRDL